MTALAETERLARLNALLVLVAERNPFQRERLSGLPLRSLEDLRGLPVTDPYSFPRFCK